MNGTLLVRKGVGWAGGGEGEGRGDGEWRVKSERAEKTAACMVKERSLLGGGEQRDTAEAAVTGVRRAAFAVMARSGRHVWHSHATVTLLQRTPPARSAKEQSLLLHLAYHDIKRITKGAAATE